LLRQQNERPPAAAALPFDFRRGPKWLNDPTGGRYAGGQKFFGGKTPPQGTAISYYLKSAPGGEIKITISDITGKVVRNLTATKEVGLNRVTWNLRGDPPTRPPGMRPGPTGDNPEVQPSSGPGQTGQPQAGQRQQEQQGEEGPPQGGFGGGGGGGRGGRFGALLGPALDPGAYLVKLSVDGKEMTTKVVIEADSLNR